MKHKGLLSSLKPIPSSLRLPVQVFMFVVQTHSNSKSHVHIAVHLFPV